MTREIPVEKEYQERRERAFSQGPQDAVWVFYAPPIARRQDDVDYPFRQASHHYYLTGFDEPHCVSVLRYNANKKKVEWSLFLEPRDPQKELWEGPMYGLDRAKDLFGADATYDIAQWSSLAPELFKDAGHVFYRMGLYESQDREVLEILQKALAMQGRTGKSLPDIKDPQRIVGEMRLVKSDMEIQIMREAAQASAKAHKEIIASIQPGMNEQEVEGRIDMLFRAHGCQRNGYPSIVASGTNATCLHYTNNNQTCQDHTLMLLDAGGERHYYTADITRTYPVGTSFTPEQEQIYDIVLHAQKTILEHVKPGATYPQLQDMAIELLCQGLADHGLLAQSVKESIDTKAYRAFYPHNLGHWLGLDVHDTGAYYLDGEPRAFEAGMVLTIEPGIYIQPHDEHFPEAYRGIGIRIEDDVLVTSGGCDVLSQEVPKEKDDILALKKS